MDNNSNNNSMVLTDDAFKNERGLKVTKLKNIDGYNINADGEIVIMTDVELKNIKSKLSDFMVKASENERKYKEYENKCNSLKNDNKSYYKELSILSKENQQLQMERLALSDEFEKLQVEYREAKERMDMLQLKCNLLEQDGSAVSYQGKVNHEILEAIVNYNNMGYSFRKIEARLKEVGLDISRETIRKCVNEYNKRFESK